MRFGLLWDSLSEADFVEGRFQDAPVTGLETDTAQVSAPAILFNGLGGQAELFRSIVETDEFIGGGAHVGSVGRVGGLSQVLS